MAHVMENESIWADRDDVGLTEDARPGLDEQLLGLYVEDCEPSVELYSASQGLSEALRSIGTSQLRNLMGFSLPISSLFSSKSSNLESSDMNCEENEVKRADATEVNAQQEETYVAKFESKYINSSVPLYQEYWMKSVKKDLHRAQAQHAGLSELVSLVRLHGLKTPPPLSPTSVLSPPGLHAKPYALWQELPQVECLLKSLSAQEIQLQEATFELIVSEASYQKSLVVALNVFQCSAELKQILSRVQHHVLFSNLKDVCRVSQRILQDLESHLRQDVVMSRVGDIVLNHQQDFQQVYVPYITNMMYQEAIITQLLQSNRKFALILKKLEKDPQCQRQTLKSFLILPFQRITRMTLLLENILKRTKGVYLNVSNLTEAIEAVRKIVEECDRSVEQMKRTELLVCLDKLVDFGNVKSIPLIKRGRHLIQEGTLKQLKIVGGDNKVSVVSHKDVYIHLFNDLLLLSVRSGPRFVVQDHALFPDNVRVEEIKTILGLPAESLLLHLPKNHNRSSSVLILAAHTRSEKETWIKVLSSK
ncbi:rho guanine nucleotide exchange factor 5 [Pimephales promelas]|uniref:rho guanine nucleotide exchange factor 5 n=1 Tax=Pimephales promelas TaxID=90988 RepID=UPI00195552BA|nr:rho guanine nucleotide exchange factor 5 [Pimephales promelas]KAG1942668.1 rho guanine nucleotide exchange factor [Pimephales promelas]